MRVLASLFIVVALAGAVAAQAPPPKPADPFNGKYGQGRRDALTGEWTYPGKRDGFGGRFGPEWYDPATSHWHYGEQGNYEWSSGKTTTTVRTIQARDRKWWKVITTKTGQQVNRQTIPLPPP